MQPIIHDLQKWSKFLCLGTVTFKKKTSFLHDLIIVPSYARRFPPKIIITRIERGVFLSLVFGLSSGRSDRAGL
jgi:hypothetical protein